MTAVELLAEVNRHGGALTQDAGKLRYRGPKRVLTEALRRSMVQHKNELLELVSTSERSEYMLGAWRLTPDGDWYRPKYRTPTTQLIDLPWPLGYGGLPADEVARAEIHNDRLDVHDPVERRLQVLQWMWQHFRDQGDQYMAQQMKDAYHELRHADPSIQALCGLCEYSEIQGRVGVDAGLDIT